jgi:putative tricarboxylic transport membrane protein
MTAEREAHPTAEREARPAFRTKSAETAVSALFLLASALVMYDSVRLGATWGADGPRPGYFPFYVGLIMAFAALVNLVRGAMVRPERNKPFVLAGQLKMVLTVLVPTVVYAVAITWVGIYASSILFIGFFMRWLGKYAWWKVAAVSVGVMVAFYFIFEIWFKVPLPKGPIEAFLGLD